jgi:hypothetical protein
MFIVQASFSGSGTWRAVSPAVTHELALLLAEQAKGMDLVDKVKVVLEIRLLNLSV